MSRNVRTGVVAGLCIVVAAGMLWAVIFRQDGTGAEGGVVDSSSEDVGWKAPVQESADSEPSISRPLPRTRSNTATAEGDSGNEEVFRALGDDGGPSNERVWGLQGMRGCVFSEYERTRAMEFLSGGEWPEGLTRGNIHWLADELLTALRLQEPPQEDLAARLAEAAFQPGTDPVVRDYIMQHLGHWWEQYGAREEIETALWRAVGTADDTTPGSALIALSRGYERDYQEKDLAVVWQRAFELARNPDTGLAVRVTALSIAGDGGGAEVMELAENLVNDPETPVILKKVAERVVGRR